MHDSSELSPDNWEEIESDGHVWVVKFHSKMCGSCQAFAPEWDKLRDAVDGLHWGELNIDEKRNMPLAEKYDVLQEGIPNVKLLSARRAPRASVACVTLRAARPLPPPTRRRSRRRRSRRVAGVHLERRRRRDGGGAREQDRGCPSAA